MRCLGHFQLVQKMELLLCLPRTAGLLLRCCAMWPLLPPAPLPLGMGAGGDGARCTHVSLAKAVAGPSLRLPAPLPLAARVPGWKWEADTAAGFAPGGQRSQEPRGISGPASQGELPLLALVGGSEGRPGSGGPCLPAPSPGKPRTLEVPSLESWGQGRRGHHRLCWLGARMSRDGHGSSFPVGKWGSYSCLTTFPEQPRGVAQSILAPRLEHLVPAGPPGLFPAACSPGPVIPMCPGTAVLAGSPCATLKSPPEKAPWQLAVARRSGPQASRAAAGESSRLSGLAR